MATPFQPNDYAWGTPPDFRPHPSYEAGLKVTREAFAALPGAPR